MGALGDFYEQCEQVLKEKHKQEENKKPDLVEDILRIVICTAIGLLPYLFIFLGYLKEIGQI